MCIYLLTNNFLSIVLTLGIGRCTHRHGYKPHSFVRDENFSTESLAIMKSPGRSMALWRNCQKVMHICLSLPKQSSNPLSRNVLSVSPKSFNAAKMFVNLFQTIYTLVNGLRYRIQRFVFAAFPLTVAPCSHVHRQSLESLDDDVVYVWGSIGASCFPCQFRVRSASGLWKLPDTLRTLTAFKDHTSYSTYANASVMNLSSLTLGVWNPYKSCCWL